MSLVTFHLTENKHLEKDIESVRKWTENSLTQEEIISLIHKFMNGNFNYSLPWLKHEKTITHTKGWTSFYSYKWKIFSKLSTIRKHLENII